MVIQTMGVIALPILLLVVTWYNLPFWFLDWSTDFVTKIELVPVIFFIFFVVPNTGFFAEQHFRVFFYFFGVVAT